MSQAEQIVAKLPNRPIDAAATYFERHLTEAKALLENVDVTALAIVMLPTAEDHVDWRRSLARDLARTYAPKRVNVVSAAPGQARDEMLAYLRDAHGVTGQYLVAHE